MGKLIGARVYNSGNISVPYSGGAATALTFDSERWDYDTIHDTVSNTDRLTCKTAGLYEICGHVAWQGTSNGTYFNLQIYLNATNFIALSTFPRASLTNNLYHNIVTYYDLAVNDYVQLRAAHDYAAGNQTILAGANYSPEFWMQRVG